MEWLASPPPPRMGESRSQFYDDVAWELKQRPGKWARVLKDSRVPNVGRNAMQNRGCETAVRKDPESGLWDLYATYSGD